MVMPIWAVERNLSGSFIKSSAMRAERLPALASLCKRNQRHFRQGEETVEGHKYQDDNNVEHIYNVLLFCCTASEEWRPAICKQSYTHSRNGKRNRQKPFYLPLLNLQNYLFLAEYSAASLLFLPILAVGLQEKRNFVQEHK